MVWWGAARWLGGSSLHEERSLCEESSQDMERFPGEGRFLQTGLGMLCEEGSQHMERFLGEPGRFLQAGPGPPR